MRKRDRVYLLVVFSFLFQGQFGFAQNVSPDVPVNNATLADQHLPSIALGPDDQIYIAWVDCRNDPTCQTDTDIYFAKSHNGGLSFDPGIPVSDDHPAFANAPRIASDESGNIYVVWHDNRAGEDSWNVYLSKSDNGGASFYPSVPVNDYISGVDQYEPDLTVDTNDNIYVSWTRKYLDDTLQLDDYDIYMATLTVGDASFGPSTKVNDGSDWQYKSSIKVDSSGNVYVTWTDRRNGGISDVYFAKSADGGATFSPNIRVNTYTDQSQGYPEMALDDDEVIYIVWNDARRLYKTNSRDIYMAHSLDRGETFEKEIRVNDLPISPEFEYLYPSVTAFSRGHVSVTWEDKRNGSWDVYLARSDNGGISFRPSWRVNSVTKKSQSVPDGVMDRYGYIYLTWRDQRGGDFDIYFAVDKSVKSIVKLLAPNGGEILPSNSGYTIGWQSLPQAVEFNLFYSLDEGVTWKEINDSPITGTTHHWTIPDPLGNKKCIVKAIGYDAEGKKVGEDRSASPFTI
ncbi:MAG: hypothetical protein MUO29_02500, partial [Desulfobacterales bacterium]|nr:hypothetical protein [Desulfobacterales bacterium]